MEKLPQIGLHLQDNENQTVIILACAYKVIQSRVSDEYIAVLTDFPNVVVSSKDKSELRAKLEYRVAEAIKNYETK